MIGDSPSQVSPLSPELVLVLVEDRGLARPGPPASGPALPVQSFPPALPGAASPCWFPPPQRDRAPPLGMQGPSPGPEPLPAATLASRSLAGIRLRGLKGECDPGDPGP